MPRINSLISSIQCGLTLLMEHTTRGWQRLLSAWRVGSVKGLLLTCLHGILSRSLLPIYYPLGFWVNSQRKKSSKHPIPLSLPLDLVVKLETLSTLRYTDLYSQTWGYKATQKLLDAGPQTWAATTLRLVLEEQLQVKALTFLLLTTLTRSKRRR